MEKKDSSISQMGQWKIMSFENWNGQLIRGRIDCSLWNLDLDIMLESQSLFAYQRLSNSLFGQYHGNYNLNWKEESHP